jgi:CBS domain-containing protein
MVPEVTDALARSLYLATSHQAKEDIVKVRELMTSEPACCTPDQTIREAAGLMRDADCGCIPVVEDNASRRLVGVVTDRDIAVRAIATGKGADTRISEVMSSGPRCCSPDDEVDTVEKIMTEQQVRRVPVVDEAGCCVGMVSQADLALNDRAASEKEVGRVVERISEPAGMR